MSYPVYYVPAGDVLPVMFDSFDGGTGASITMTGLAVTDIEIYKDGSVTQRASDAGYTLLDTDGIDFDGITGIHGFSIDTGDNTDAGFYTVGAWFHVVVSAITIDAQTVNFIACAFRLMAAESIAAKPKVDVDGWLGTAAATPTVAGVPEVDLTHVGGTAVTAAAGIPEVKVASIAANAITATAINADAITAAKVAADVATEINAGVLAVLGALADAASDGDPTGTDTMVAYLKQIINTLEGTAGLPAWPAAAAPANAVSIAEALRYLYDQVGVAGAGLAAVPWNAAWDAEVQSEVQDALEATIADSIPADGSRPSALQALYMIVQFLYESAVSGTTITIYKPDGTTALATLTINDATNPTSKTRAT